MRRLLFGVYLAAVAMITLQPARVDEGAEDALAGLIARLRSLGVPEWLDYGAIEVTANVVMFVPFGFLLYLVTPAPLESPSTVPSSRRAVRQSRQWRRGLLKVFLITSGAVVISAGIEAVQRAFLPERVYSVSDILANGTGALLGAATTWLLAGTGRMGLGAKPPPA